MNRRSIFKLLAGAACAAAMEITGIVPSLPKAAKYVINPEYLNAAYEDLVIVAPTKTMTARIIRNKTPGECKPLEVPLPDGLPGGMFSDCTLVGSPEAVRRLTSARKIVNPLVHRYDFRDGAMARH